MPRVSLDEAAFQMRRINSSIQSVRLSNLEKLRTLERIVSELYAEASSKITQISAESKLLATLSGESAEHARELEPYLQHS
jgi:hypothetical protein